ncbi:MAG: hypothetical protein DI606_13735 [Sphingobium sp.]|nr:MAG: hypothetical protein DI606_13735 [Sphingobium sp.]
MSAASAWPDIAPGETIHAAAPVTGASVEGKSCLMQRQPVCGIGADTMIGPAIPYRDPVKSPFARTNLSGM